MTKTNLLRPFLTAAIVFTGGFLMTGSLRAAVGDIYETNNGTVLRFASTSTTPITFVSGLSNPKGLVFDGKGHVYVADAGRNSIVLFTTIDASGTTYASGLSSPIGLALDGTGNLFEADSGSGNIFKFAQADATKTTFASGVGAIAGLAFDANGNLYAADFTNGAILKFTPDGTKSTFASGLSFPAGLAVDGSGNVFEADSGSNTIFKFTPAGVKSSFATGLSLPYGLAFDNSGNLVVADHDSGSTLRFAPDGTKTVVFTSKFNTPQFVAVEPSVHQLLNLSTRGFVQTGDRVLIAGFIIGGTGPIGNKVVVRAIGPSLTAAGITDALQDPVLELHDASGAIVATNDNWKDSQQDLITASNLAPTDDRESAILTSLLGGSYTAVVRGVNNTTGTAVVEVYNLQ
jgi:sugar lactone lactonase YvrE